MTYEAILDLAKRNPESVDFGEFRFAFTRTDSYEQFPPHPWLALLEGQPYDYALQEEDEPLEEAAQRSDWVNVLVRARSALERCYVRITPHAYAAAVCEALGDDLGQRHHQECFKGLVASIMKSGDGRTKETAFVVIGVWEEYEVLDVLKLQKLQTKREVVCFVGDRYIDQMTVQSHTGSDPFELYFDVTVALTPRVEHEAEPKQKRRASVKSDWRRSRTSR